MARANRKLAAALAEIAGRLAQTFDVDQRRLLALEPAALGLAMLGPALQLASDLQGKMLTVQSKLPEPMLLRRLKRPMLSDFSDDASLLERPYRATDTRHRRTFRMARVVISNSSLAAIDPGTVAPERFT
jgi:hypothetical protein